MKLASIAALAAGLALAAIGGAQASVNGAMAARQVAADGPATATRGLVMEARHRQYRHTRYHGYRGPGYGGGYVTAPRYDWTTHCMEDLGYGRRGMYGCGGR
jgi:hypothetical protein